MIKFRKWIVIVVFLSIRHELTMLFEIEYAQSIWKIIVHVYLLLMIYIAT